MILLSGGWPKVRYIDGFAGRGSYQSDDGSVFGSPIELLRLLERENREAEVETVFIERDPRYFEELKAAVMVQQKHRPQLIPPLLINDTFVAGGVQLRELETRPTFLFADPCGVDGLDFHTIGELTASGGSELLLFFNYAGVSRIAGLEHKEGKTLDRLLGSPKSTKYLLGKLKSLDAGEAREREILRVYTRLLEQQQRWEYVVPFRMEAESSARTSHYFIFATKNKTGFAIMKDIMWGLGHDGQEKGGLMYAQKSRTDQTAFFHPAAIEQREAILLQIPAEGIPYSFFTDDLPRQRRNLLVAPVYRKRLRELEAAGLIRLLMNGNPRERARRSKTGGVRRPKEVTVHRVS